MELAYEVEKIWSALSTLGVRRDDVCPATVTMTEPISDADRRKDLGRDWQYVVKNQRCLHVVKHDGPHFAIVTFPAKYPERTNASYPTVVKVKW